MSSGVEHVKRKGWIVQLGERSILVPCPRGKGRCPASGCFVASTDAGGQGEHPDCALTKAAALKDAWKRKGCRLDQAMRAAQ